MTVLLFSGKTSKSNILAKTVFVLFLFLKCTALYLAANEVIDEV